MDINIKNFHIGFEYEQYQMDSERYFNKGMIWVKKTYSMTSPRLHKIKILIDKKEVRLIKKQNKEPKDKAKELVSKFTFYQLPEDKRILIDNPKQCALTCVDEKIETLLPYAGLLDIKKEVQELEEIKEEVNKL
tara:strand:- start:1053 stop:1454 length:402 start_codon:yes stop_codon:yes gene_type:complete